MTTVYISPAAAQTFATTLLTTHNVPPDRAAQIATSLTLADLRGVDTHGINRLPGYITRLQHGVLTPNPPLVFTQRTPVMALLEAKHTFGFIAASAAIDRGVEMARTYGAGIVAVKHSSHYGMAATYLLRAIRQGYAAMAFTNASRSMPPWGAREPLLGTSPFAVGVPGGEEGDFVLDMSPSVAARGKIRKAARRGESIPEGYALDGEGRATTDPRAALDGGVVLPIGGPKGSGLAMMMDVFGGLMSGAAFAGDVNDQYANLEQAQDVGHWFLVFRPEVFLEGGMGELRGRMDVLLRRVRECDKAAGVERIYTSGEMEAEMEEKRNAQGIPYSRGEVDALDELARQSGLDIKLEEL